MALVDAVVIMGVSGSGKSTVGSKLATHLGWAFEDGDSYHPAENIRKISEGVPLSDLYRQPWLERLTGVISRHARSGERLVLACSALKESYRRELASSGAALLYVYLQGDATLMGERIESRRGHFARRDIIESQYAALEEPRGENVLVVDGELPVTSLVNGIARHLERHTTS